MIFWVIAASGVTAAQAAGDAAVRAAIAAAVQTRVDQHAVVSLDLRVVDVAVGARLDGADPEPGARFGRPARFRLRASGRTVGYAIGIAHVTTPHVRLVRAVDAGAVITDQDVREVMADPGPQLIAPLPRLDAVLGSASSRALAADEVVTTRMVRAAPAVKSGDVVTTRVVMDGVEAIGSATALQSGGVGDIIRLVNAESRRQLRGRVTGKSAVEVQHES